MNGMIKKYLPFALIIFGVYLLVPLIFLIPGLNNFSAVAYYFIFLVTQVACSAFYCSKHGLDFLFALIAPIAFLFTMMIYAGGFTNFTNIILLVVYLIAGARRRKSRLPKSFFCRQSAATNASVSFTARAAARLSAHEQKDPAVLSKAQAVATRSLHALHRRTVTTISTAATPLTWTRSLTSASTDCSTRINKNKRRGSASPVFYMQYKFVSHAGMYGWCRR